MATRTEPWLLVLHVLRVKGLAETDVVAEVTGLDDVTVVRLLEARRDEGLVLRRDGVDVSGWVLAPAGRAAHEQALADELDRTGARPEIEAAHAEFCVLNPELLAVCTDWQLRPGEGGTGPGEVNDHTDADYDRAVAERLVDLHGRARPMLDRLTGALARFAGYRPRLDRAVGKVAAGDGDWFTKPLTDSYHTVWFELHEDLLATLGRVRSATSEPGETVAAGA